MSLRAYLDRHNRTATVWPGMKTLDINDKETIILNLESELSPENLTCDGEADPAHVARKARFLNAALEEARLL
jgi:hypothetical protein